MLHVNLIHPTLIPSEPTDAALAKIHPPTTEGTDNRVLDVAYVGVHCAINPSLSSDANGSLRIKSVFLLFS
jgi:hypothetical protein